MVEVIQGNSITVVIPMPTVTEVYLQILTGLIKKSVAIYVGNMSGYDNVFKLIVL